LGTGSYTGSVLVLPTGIAATTTGTGCASTHYCIYVADSFNNRIVKFIAGSGSATYSTTIGSAGYGNGSFENPTGVAVDSSGTVWVVDSMNNRVQEFTVSSSY